MFLFHQPASKRTECAGLTLEPMSFWNIEGTRLTPTSSDLTFTVGETPDGVAITLSYKIALFNEATIDGVLEQFAALANWLGRDPETRLSALQTESEPDNGCRVALT
jgi:hypothetical protein